MKNIWKWIAEKIRLGWSVAAGWVDKNPEGVIILLEKSADKVHDTKNGKKTAENS